MQLSLCFEELALGAWTVIARFRAGKGEHLRLKMPGPGLQDLPGLPRTLVGTNRDLLLVVPAIIIP